MNVHTVHSHVCSISQNPMHFVRGRLHCRKSSSAESSSHTLRLVLYPWAQSHCILFISQTPTVASFDTVCVVRCVSAHTSRLQRSARCARTTQYVAHPVLNWLKVCHKKCARRSHILPSPPAQKTPFLHGYPISLSQLTLHVENSVGGGSLL